MDFVKGESVKVELAHGDKHGTVVDNIDGLHVAVRWESGNVTSVPKRRLDKMPSDYSSVLDIKAKIEELVAKIELHTKVGRSEQRDDLLYFDALLKVRDACEHALEKVWEARKDS